MKKLMITAILGSIFLLTQLSSTLYLAAMPSMVTVLHTKIHVVMVTLTIFFLGYGIGQLFWGTLSDRFGRKPILIASLILYALTALLIPDSNNLYIFSFMYATLGFIAAAYTSVGNAVIKDIYQDKAAHAISAIGIFMASGPALGPFLGGIFVRWVHWQGIFYFMSGLSLLILFLIAVFVPETHHSMHRISENKTSTFQIINDLFRNKIYMAYLLCLGLIFGSSFSFFDYSPFLFTNYLHTSAKIYSFLFATAALSYFFGAIMSFVLIRKIKIYQIVLFGTIISFIGAILLTILFDIHIHQISLILPFIMIMMIGFGLVISTAKGGAMISIKQHNGKAAAMMKFVQTSFAVGLMAVTAKLQNLHNVIIIFSLLLISTLSALLLFIYLNKLAQRAMLLSQENFPTKQLKDIK